LAARELVDKLLTQLKPEDQLVVRMLDLESAQHRGNRGCHRLEPITRKSPGLPRPAEVAEAFSGITEEGKIKMFIYDVVSRIKTNKQTLDQFQQIQDAKFMLDKQYTCDECS